MSGANAIQKPGYLAIRILVYAVAAASTAWCAWSMYDWFEGDPSGKVQFIRAPLATQIYFSTEVFLMTLCALCIADQCCRAAWISLRPRFSMRTLIVGVMLFCLYLGAWQFTKRFGEYRHPGGSKSQDETSPMPFVITKVESSYIQGSAVRRYRFYLWLFGWKVETPITSPWRKP